MVHLAVVLPFATLALATIPLSDPSDGISPADWAADNAILADYKDASSNMYQWITVIGSDVYNKQTSSISHKTLSVSGNDTSILVVANTSEVTLDYSTLVKFGYSSDLVQASFFGVNAAINVANDSILHASNINVTTHNGAANLYAYGTGSVAYVDNAWLYSSGPVSHGLYAGGNGTVYGTNIRHYSGGNRCSSFSGDTPAGYIHITDAIAHTDGIGSATCYALGLCNMTNVIGYTRNAPAMFADGSQTGYWKNCDLTAGLLGGIVMFSSSTRESGASVTLDNTKLTVLGDSVPALWFGNVVATANLVSATINNSESGLLAVANYSQMTQDFAYYADYSDNNELSPAELTLNIASSSVSGDLVAYNGSSIALNLTSYSSWTGAARSGSAGNSTTALNGTGTTAASFGVYLDATSNWTLTANTTVLNFTSADASLANVDSNGFTLSYHSNSSVNAVYKGKSIGLRGGGVFKPL